MQVTINEKEGFVTIENNGHGLPVEASSEFRFFRPRHMKTPQVTASPSQPFLQWKSKISKRLLGHMLSAGAQGASDVCTGACRGLMQFLQKGLGRLPETSWCSAFYFYFFHQTCRLLNAWVHKKERRWIYTPQRHSRTDLCAAVAALRAVLQQHCYPVLLCTIASKSKLCKIWWRRYAARTLAQWHVLHIWPRCLDICWPATTTMTARRRPAMAWCRDIVMSWCRAAQGHRWSKRLWCEAHKHFLQKVRDQVIISLWILWILWSL